SRTSYGSMIELRLVRKHQADGIAFDPTDSGFKARSVTELQLDQVPKLRREAAADHGSATREVHHLHWVRRALVDCRLHLCVQPVPIAAAMIAAAGFGTRN